MLRRKAVSLLFGAFGSIGSAASAKLDQLLEPARGAAILLDIKGRRLVATNSAPLISATLTVPGSTLKPFVLAALLKHGKLKPETPYLCPGRLTIGNRRFDCTHPVLAVPMRPDTALAYSCNCFVAHAAERFDPGELSRELERIGFASPTGLIPGPEASGKIAPAGTLDAVRLQAIGEAGILLTPLELALAYRNLALESGTPGMQPILAGLEGAVEFGTAQRARVAGTIVAGKTGSTRSPAGNFIAWFVGFMPARAPETVVAVMLSGHSGGADAAPVAARILEAHRAGRL